MLTRNRSITDSGTVTTFGEPWFVRDAANAILTFLISGPPRGQTPLIPERIIRPPEPSPNLKSPISNVQSTILLIPAPPKQSARDMRPLRRDLISQTWGGDPLECPCCKGAMKPARKVIRREEIEKRRRRVGVLDRNPRSG